MYVKVKKAGNVSCRGTLYVCQGHKIAGGLFMCVKDTKPGNFLSGDSLCMSRSQKQVTFLVGGLFMYVKVTKPGNVSCRGTLYVCQSHKTR